jgi:hypothetical protein
VRVGVGDVEEKLEGSLQGVRFWGLAPAKFNLRKGLAEIQAQAHCYTTNALPLNTNINNNILTYKDIQS